MAYMKRQWIDNPTFRPEDWSVFKQTVRTNNDVEGWHHRINTKAVTSSLTFYKLVPLLRREAELVKVAVESGDLERGSSARTDRLDKSLSVGSVTALLQRRKTRAKMTIQGNFHPVTTMALTENQEARFTLLTTNVHGVASLVSGWLEAILDRRLVQDDWRGLSEPVTDNIPVSSTFFLLFEERDGVAYQVKRQNGMCLPSPTADRLSEELNNPLAISDMTTQLPGSCSPKMTLSRGLPCGHHIINFRMLAGSKDSKEALVVIHHRATDCDFTTTQICTNNERWGFKEIFSLAITEVKEMSLTGTQVKQSIKVDEPIHIDPMEIKTYKITFR